MDNVNSKDLCNILFGVKEINSELDAQCVALNNEKNSEFLSFYYKQLLENNPYVITKTSKGDYDSEIESDSMFRLRDLGICSTKIIESNDKIKIVFTLNENYKDYFSKFYDKKLRALQNELFF